MASEMVMAYGDHGLELTPEAETVAIRARPGGPNNEVLPASLRFLRGAQGGGTPTRLVRVERPRNGRSYAYAKFECTPYVLYTLDSGPVYGTQTSCHIRNEADANDPLFARLTGRERARMAKAAALAVQP